MLPLAEKQNLKIGLNFRLRSMAKAEKESAGNDE